MLTTFTKLDAVNQILSAIGSDPVTTIDDGMDIDVINALKILEDKSRDIQRKGWNFNKVTRTFSPDKDTKKIYWDTTIMSLKSSDGNTYVKRGAFLYDINNDNYTFSKPIEATIVYAVNFEDLPECFQNYITASAAVDFQTRYFGSDTATSQDLGMRLQEAWQDIVAYDMDMQDVNVLNLTGVSEVLQRT